MILKYFLLFLKFFQGSTWLQILAVETKIHLMSRKKKSPESFSTQTYKSWYFPLCVWHHNDNSVKDSFKPGARKGKLSLWRHEHTCSQYREWPPSSNVLVTVISNNLLYEVHKNSLHQPHAPVLAWEYAHWIQCCCCSVAKLCPTLWDPMDCTCQASLFFTISQSLLKLTSIESVMPSNHLLLCHPLLLLPSTFPSIRVFSNELALCIRWPKYWSFSFSISPSNEYSGLMSFRIDWLDLLGVQGTLKSLLQHHSLRYKDNQKKSIVSSSEEI